LSAPTPEATPEKPRPVRGFSFPTSAANSWKATRTDTLLAGVVLGALFVAALVAMRHRGSYTDELDHFAQIELFVRGEWRVLSRYLTTIPGYHALVAAILSVFGVDSLNAARLVNAAFALVAVGTFHALRRRAWPGTETLATAQLLVLPILVPLFFLVYTDVLALALLLLATLATLASRHVISALLLVALVFVRQNEVVFAGFLAALAAWPLWQSRGRSALRKIVVAAIPYALPVLAFLAFWAWNGSISLSKEQMGVHPDASFHAGNLFFAVFLAGVLLPLHAVAGFAEFVARAREKPWLIAIPPLVFAAFWFGFRSDNPYNAQIPTYFIRNGLLLAIANEPSVRAITAAITTIAACGLAPTRLAPRAAYWLYPVAALFLSASWLVEQRYALVPFVLFLAFREHRGRAVEWATAALWLLLAVLVFGGMMAVRFFI
jgi:alpha-1,2-glucosyltransferase